MSILNAYLIKNCTEEQSSLLINCFETLSRIGLVEIDFNIDELLGLTESEELFTVIQICYEKIRKFQNLAFDQLELKVVTTDEASAANDLLLYLDQLENSEAHNWITTIIDNSPTPEDALFALLEQVLFADTHSIRGIVDEVPTSFIERVYETHKVDSDLIEITGKVLVEFDQRKLDLILHYWNVRQINSLKNYILNNNINLPIRKSVWESVMKKEMQNPGLMLNKTFVARKILEGVLVMNVKWKDIKRAMKQLANELYDDPLYRAQLSYEIDNVCMAENINESF